MSLACIIAQKDFRINKILNEDYYTDYATSVLLAKVPGTLALKKFRVSGITFNITSCCCFFPCSSQPYLH